jgi:hypothetical protein
MATLYNDVQGATRLVFLPVVMVLSYLLLGVHLCTSTRGVSFVRTGAVYMLRGRDIVWNLYNSFCL